jgi:hypothetical protein
MADYPHWKFRIQLVLEVRELWTVVDGTFPKPNATTDSIEYADWCYKDREARLQIVLTLRDGPLTVVMGAKTAKEFWDRLSARYEGKEILHLMDVLYPRTFSEFEPLEPQINRRLLAARTLEALGCPLGNKTLATLLMIALPGSMSALKSILYDTPTAERCPDHITSQILLEEQRRVRESGESIAVYYSKAAKRVKSKDKSDERDEKYCTHCKREGHDKAECRKLKKEQEVEAAEWA